MFLSRYLRMITVITISLFSLVATLIFLAFNNSQPKRIEKTKLTYEISSSLDHSTFLRIFFLSQHSLNQAIYYLSVIFRILFLLSSN